MAKVTLLRACAWRRRSCRRTLIVSCSDILNANFRAANFTSMALSAVSKYRLAAAIELVLELELLLAFAAAAAAAAVGVTGGTGAALLCTAALMAAERGREV